MKRQSLAILISLLLFRGLFAFCGFPQAGCPTFPVSSQARGPLGPSDLFLAFQPRATQRKFSSSREQPRLLVFCFVMLCFNSNNTHRFLIRGIPICWNLAELRLFTSEMVERSDFYHHRAVGSPVRISQVARLLLGSSKFNLSHLLSLSLLNLLTPILKPSPSLPLKVWVSSV